MDGEMKCYLLSIESEGEKRMTDWLGEILCACG